MKKLLLFFTLTTFCIGSYGQKITELPVVTSASGSTLLMVAPSGNALKRVTKANFLSDVYDSLALKMSSGNVTFTGLTKLQQLKLGTAGDTLTSITLTGGNIHFFKGITEYSAVPGTGSAVWGGITGLISAQNDLTSALNAKADLSSPTFTGTVGGVTAAMVSAMSTSHAANAISGTNITNWNTAYGWGNHASAGYAFSTDLAGYVPSTRTINGHNLMGNVTVTLSDIGAAASSHTHTQANVTGLPDTLLNHNTKAQDNLLFAPLSHTQTQSTITGLPDSLLNHNTKAQDAIITHDSLDNRFNNSVSGNTLYPELLDTIPKFVFLAGSGEAGDSVLFAKGKRSFGVFKTNSDTTVSVSIDIIKISTADSCKFNIYFGNYATGVATDSLFSSVQGAGPTQRTLSTSGKKITPFKDVWLGLKADQVTAKRPNEMAIQLNTKTIPRY